MTMTDKRPAQRGDTPADKAYSNDRRAGRTYPGEIEHLSDMDHRHPINRGLVRETRAVPNRLNRRMRGHRLPVDLEQCRRPADRGTNR